MQTSLNLTLTGFSTRESISISSEGSGLFEIRETVTTATTNAPITLSADVSKIEFVYILATKAMTLKTYDSGGSTVIDTIALVANSPVLFKRSPALGTNPFSADFSSASITNASGSTGNLTILILTDATP
jgi:hypothetical protein